MEVQKNIINNFFRDLKFEAEEHKYTVGNNQLPSVSGLIKNFATEFDRENIAIRSANKRGIPVEQVLKEWDETRDEACDRGHRVHLFGENYVWDRTLKPSCKQEEAIVKFWNDIPEHIVPFQMELTMYHKLFLFAGTCDILLYDTIKKVFILADYKTNKDLFKNFKKKKLKYPFHFMLDMPYSKYEIQLSFYQLLFEQAGFKIDSRKIIWLQLDGTYKMYDTQDWTIELKDYLLKRN